MSKGPWEDSDVTRVDEGSRTHPKWPCATFGLQTVKVLGRRGRKKVIRDYFNEMKDHNLKSPTSRVAGGGDGADGLV